MRCVRQTIATVWTVIEGIQEFLNWQLTEIHERTLQTRINGNWRGRHLKENWLFAYLYLPSLSLVPTDYIFRIFHLRFYHFVPCDGYKVPVIPSFFLNLCFNKLIACFTRYNWSESCHMFVIAVKHENYIVMKKKKNDLSICNRIKSLVKHYPFVRDDLRKQISPCH